MLSFAIPSQALRPEPPSTVAAIARDTVALGFTMASEPRTGALLRVLAAAKPSGRFLELGTGTGQGAAWLLAGMNQSSTLVTVECDPEPAAIARRHLGADPRLDIRVEDASAFIKGEPAGRYDLVFADSIPGKFEGLEDALDLVATGGFYVIDDMLPQANWPEGHGRRVDELLGDLDRRADFARLALDWASGIVILVRTSPGP